MKALSVRTKLTLWNVGILALALTWLGLAIFYGARQSLLSAVDREVQSRAERVANRLRTTPPRSPEVRVMLDGARGDNPVVSIASPREPIRISMQEVTPGHYEGTHVFPSGPAGNDPARPRFGARILDLGGRTNSGEPPYDDKAFIKGVDGVQSVSEIVIDKEPVRVLTIPVEREDGSRRILQYAHPLTEVYNALASLTLVLVTVMPLILLIAAVGGAFLTRRALQPVQDITDTAAQVSAESLAGRLEVKGKDEFSSLAKTFNGMLERLQGAFVRMEEAVEQQRRFTADASHELRTPLTVIKANTSLALKGERTPEQYKKTLTAVNAAADSMSRLVSDLLLLARSDTGRLELTSEPVALGPLLRDAAASVARPGAALISVEMDDERAQVLGDDHALSRVFVNLLENAVRHTPAEGSISVRTISQERHVEVQVADTGCGIAAEHIPHITDRFYRVDEARAREEGGNGLGLAICSSIVEAHRGTLRVESELGTGTLVCVALPRASKPAADLETDSVRIA